MSAYLVTPRTIKAMVQYIGDVDLGRYHHCTMDEAAEMLYDENMRSLGARYGDATSSVEKGKYLKEVVGKGWEYCALPDEKAIDLIKIAKCYQYQTCEHKGHEESKAWKISDAVISRAIRKLPGYDEAPWGLRDEPEAEVISLGALAKKLAKK